jgi:enoyl-CoA hydratase/carnithine racemase
MSDIITERSAGILRLELNHPARKNAMTAGMYTSLAGTEKRPPNFTNAATPVAAE